MGTNIQGIGISALAAAQAAIATTSHNISNATVAGYNRQVVEQSSAGAINYGSGFVGQGTQIADITRVYDQFTSKQVLTSQSTSSALSAYGSEIGAIDNLLADSSAGLSPALQSFFTSLQDLSSNPNAAASRQSVLSNAQTLTETLHSLNDQMVQSRNSINSQITSSVTSINSYAQQIAQLNTSIAQATTSGGQPPNDLLDQRDAVIASLNKVVKVSTVAQDNGAYSVFIGTGQPLVLGASVSTLTATPSIADPTRLEVAYSTGNKNVILPDASISGGTLGGLLDYRSSTLDAAQNSLGRIAVALTQSFNAQNKLGLDQNGNPGGNFFTVADPAVTAGTNNSAGVLTAKVTNASQLSTSDYTMKFDGTNFTINRTSDGTKTIFAAPVSAPTTFSQVVDGVTFSGDAATMSAGDSFLVQPTINAAGSMTVALASTQNIAAAAPITTGITAVSSINSTNGTPGTPNTGTGVVSGGAVDSTVLSPGTTFTYTYASGTGTLALTQTPATPVPGAVTVTDTSGNVTNFAAGAAITYSAGATISSGGASFILSGTPANGDTFNLAPTTANTGNATISAGSIDSSYLSAPLTSTSTFRFNSTASTLILTPSAATSVKDVNGIVTNYASGAAIAYSPGATYTTGGASFTITGQPSNGDTFTLGPNVSGVSDNRNSELLSGLQTSNQIGNTTFQGSYSQLVSQIGNKTNQNNVMQTAETTRLKLLTAEQQSISGVNQDEELAKLVQYQQAYQAGAKIIQAASDMMTTLFNL
ncbi:flagellar hook-associated protein FlgK [Herbaspirillum sp. RTI4]|uniref:flagellar hook-associated protein FlgK n=1 Tax=Herbaspirillum sp. RTI4 TaxID=3048640 RepID=UPI002AB58C70|nr:flagellar hook-associated protein FlgK [Herbaspirillum sp. RTI4]MDY7578305.1 flagellar hook-associated protein FlgK [Herbaspirillum sp. RTI4]MEA9981202.1 flagellar hook-associated protein FlgK [Herbaspirillum sp. RTI4]